jgi:hypothetical protein
LEAIVTERISNARRHWQFSVSSLMAALVAPALLFSWLALLNRVPPLDRRDQECQWCADPLSEFSPKEGTSVRQGDDLMKLARVFRAWQDGRYYGQSSWVTPAGMVHEEALTPFDHWCDRDTAFTSPGNVMGLLSLLWDLPPSDPGAKPGNCLRVAFPVKGRWAVRVYRCDAVPKEVIELTKALGLHYDWLHQMRSRVP